VSAIKSFDEKIEKIDLATAEKLLNEFKGSKPIQPRLDQISKDLGDVTWSFRVLPNEIEQTISLVARYNRQLSLVPFSKIMAVCVTPLRQPADLANAPSKDNIENAVFYEELDGELRMRNLTMIGMGWLMFSSTRHSQRFPGIHPLQKRRSSEEWWLVSALRMYFKSMRLIHFICFAVLSISGLAKAQSENDMSFDAISGLKNVRSLAFDTKAETLFVTLPNRTLHFDLYPLRLKGTVEHEFTATSNGVSPEGDLFVV